MAEDQRNSPKLLIGIIGGLCVLAALFFAYQWFSAPPAEQPETPVQPPSEAQPASEPAAAHALPASEPASEAAPLETHTAPLVSEDIVKAPIPDNASLAKEEQAKLEDLQAQLAEQEKTLKAQHADADKLIQLKEEQLKLLKQQLGEEH